MSVSANDNQLLPSGNEPGDVLTDDGLPETVPPRVFLMVPFGGDFHIFFSLNCSRDKAEGKGRNSFNKTIDEAEIEQRHIRKKG